MANQRRDEQSFFLRRFGARLRDLRQERNLTQEELAEAAGFSRSYYTEIETGKRNISLLNLQRLAKCLKLKVSELVDFEERRSR